MSPNFTLYIYNKNKYSKDENYFIALNDFFEDDKKLKILLQRNKKTILKAPCIKALNK